MSRTPEPNETDGAEDVPVRLTPEPRARSPRKSPPIRIEGDPERFRGQIGDADLPAEPQAHEVVRLHPERLTGLRPEQTVTYADLVHDENRKVRSPGELQDWGGAGRTPSMRWLYLSAALVGLLLVGAIFSMTELARHAPKVNPIGMPKLLIEPRIEEPREEHIAELLGCADDARDLFGRFLRSTTASEIEPLIRRDPGTLPLLGRLHRLANLPDGWKVPPDSTWEVHTDQEPVYGVLSGHFPDESSFAAFITLEGKGLVIDWKATNGYGTASFSKLATGEGDGSEIRTWIEPAVFYSTGYPESEYRAYRLYQTLEDPAVWGYARRGGEVEKRLEAVFKKGLILQSKPKPRRHVVELTRPSAQALPNQWLISRLLHDGWLVP